MSISGVNKIGFWSAVFSTIFAFLYIIPQLIIGIDMPSSPRDLFFILTPSLLLAPSFLILMVSVHYYTSDKEKIWSHIGLTFSGAYFIFVSIVYFVGLTIQIPHTIQGDLDKFELLLYVPKSFMTAVDALGYASMSLATLFAAPGFSKQGLEKYIRWVFIAHGCLAPIILLTQIYPSIAYIGAIWIITFPLSTILLALLFKRAGA